MASRSAPHATLPSPHSQPIFPTPILADLTGMHRHTAIRWVFYARRDWAEYLAARAEDEAKERKAKG